MHQIYFVDNSIVDLERPVERLVALRVSFGDPVGGCGTGRPSWAHNHVRVLGPWHQTLAFEPPLLHCVDSCCSQLGPRLVAQLSL